jgi:hypothetical protein
MGRWIHSYKYVLYFKPLPLKMYEIQWISPLTPNNLQRRRAVSPLKIKIPSKNMHEKPTNATIIHSVY